MLQCPLLLVPQAARVENPHGVWTFSCSMAQARASPWVMPSLHLPLFSPHSIPSMDGVAQLRGSPRRTRRRPPIECTQPPTAPSKPVVRTPPPPPLSLVFFSASVMFDELPPTDFCVIAASGRRRASRFARSTKRRAVWTTHVTNLDSSRSFTWYFMD
jgi:hypothetical protein